MITINNFKTPDSSIETLYLSGCLDHAQPDVVSSLTIVYADLTTAQKSVYTSFFNLGQDVYVTISNTVCLLNIDRVTSKDIAEEGITLDYNTLSTANKAKVDAFENLVHTLGTIE